MRFSKYEGTGNDFVMLADVADDLRLTPELVRQLCDRRFGIGADGVIRVAPGGTDADLFMDYVNADGSIGEMCGNGIRCLAVFARAEGLTTERNLRVSTRAGLKFVEVLDDGRVRVDMGLPTFAPGDIPVEWEGGEALHVKLELDPAAELGDVVEATCLSMGNPHAVLFVDDPARAPVTIAGPLIENHAWFPRKVNVEFVRVQSPKRVSMRVWERGVGETMSCGTGACAAAVAARVVAGADASVTVTVPGGELDVTWEGALHRRAPVLLTGPARESFRGETAVESAA